MDSDHDSDSLFGSDASHDAVVNCGTESYHVEPVASRFAPDIPGLFLFPHLLSRDLHDRVLRQVSACDYFVLQDNADRALPPNGQQTPLDPAYRRSSRNQAMLFARSLPPPLNEIDTDDPKPTIGARTGHHPQDCSGLPAWATELIQHLRHLIQSLSENQLPSSVKHLLFPAHQLRSRQLILNLYDAAEGLASHVDLVNRFADGILLCSFGPRGTGTVMDFTHDSHAPHHLFLPSGSVLVLSGEARYDWSHGITARHTDLVRSVHPQAHVDVLQRSIRLSITIRSMLPGADVVGE